MLPTTPTNNPDSQSSVQTQPTATEAFTNAVIGDYVAIVDSDDNGSITMKIIDKSPHRLKLLVTRNLKNYWVFYKNNHWRFR